MLRIGLLSDTHGWLDPALEKHFAGCDEIWHAGDIGGLAVTDELARWKPLRAVHGNIDDATMRREFPADRRSEVEGLRVWPTHIGGQLAMTGAWRSNYARTRPGSSSAGTRTSAWCNGTSG